MIYIAGPYWHKDFHMRAYRAQTHAVYARHLIERSHPAFSPVAHGHFIDIQPTNKPITNDAWIQISLGLMTACNQLHILDFRDWQASKGTTLELAEARRRKLPIKLVRLDDFTTTDYA